MTLKDFFNLFLLISALHGFLFCVLLLFSKNGKKTSIVFINLLVLSISLNNFQSWFFIKDIFIEHLFLKYFEIPWHFLVAPFFYMFLIHYLKIEKKHFNILKIVIPFFIVLILIRIGFLYAYNEQDISKISFLFKRHTAIEEVVSIIFSLAVFGYSFYLFTRAKKEKTLTKTLRYDNLKWIYKFFYISAFAYIFWLIPLIITIALNYKVLIYSYYPLRVFTTILIYWLGYQSVLQLRIFNERKYLHEQLNATLNNQTAIKTTKEVPAVLIHANEINIPEDVIKDVLNGLDLFEKKQEYTSQKNTLNSLAKKLNTNTNYLSKIINHYKNTSFSNYLNTLRINNIIYQLETNSIIRKFTIKAIAQEAGFNTADSFSKVFFKIKKVRPSDYIKNLEKNNV